jgi:hypothetical protein
MEKKNAPMAIATEPVASEPVASQPVASQPVAMNKSCVILFKFCLFAVAFA